MIVALCSPRRGTDRGSMVGGRPGAKQRRRPEPAWFGELAARGLRLPRAMVPSGACGMGGLRSWASRRPAGKVGEGHCHLLEAGRTRGVVADGLAVPARDGRWDTPGRCRPGTPTGPRGLVYAKMRIRPHRTGRGGRAVFDPDLRQELEELTRGACKALNDPKRLMILYALDGRPRSVGELSDLLGVPQPNVSQHLAVLRERRLVEVERDGNRAIYALGDPRVIQAIDILRQVARDGLGRRLAIRSAR